MKNIEYLKKNHKKPLIVLKTFVSESGLITFLESTRVPNLERACDILRKFSESQSDNVLEELKVNSNEEVDDYLYYLIEDTINFNSYGIQYPPTTRAEVRKTSIGYIAFALLYVPEARVTLKKLELEGRSDINKLLANYKFLAEAIRKKVIRNRSERTVLEFGNIDEPGYTPSSDWGGYYRRLTYQNGDYIDQSGYTEAQLLEILDTTVKDYITIAPKFGRKNHLDVIAQFLNFCKLPAVKEYLTKNSNLL